MTSAAHLWVGVDPGKTGGIVVLDQDGRYVAHTLMPLVGKGTKRARVDCRTLSRWWAKLRWPELDDEHDPGLLRVTWAIERVSSAPTDGVVSAFTFGKVTGAIFAFAETVDCAITEVSPRDWQKVMLYGHRRGNREQIKASAALVASDRWPQLSEDLQVKARWGLSDAALIADTARLVELARATTITP